MVDGAQGLGGFLVVAKAQDRERHGLAVVGDGLQLFHNAVNGMVVVAGKSTVRSLKNAVVSVLTMVLVLPVPGGPCT